MKIFKSSLPPQQRSRRASSQCVCRRSSAAARASYAWSQQCRTPWPWGASAGRSLSVASWPWSTGTASASPTADAWTWSWGKRRKSRWTDGKPELIVKNMLQFLVQNKTPIIGLISHDTNKLFHSLLTLLSAPMSLNCRFESIFMRTSAGSSTMSRDLWLRALAADDTDDITDAAEEEWRSLEIDKSLVQTCQIITLWKWGSLHTRTRKSVGKRQGWWISGWRFLSRFFSA